MKTFITKMRIALVLLAGVCVPMQAKVIGQNPPANPLTAEYVRATLPKSEQAAWLQYIDRSTKQQAADRAAWAAEFKASGRATVLIPPQGGGRSMPMDRDPAWYGTADALKIADVVLSFQTPNGGWSKNLSMTQAARVPGEFYAAPNLTPALPGDTDADRARANERAHSADWGWVATLDNDATNTELHYLRLVIAALPAEESAPYRKSYLRGIDYLLGSQYPNGGWPQVWPLAGGYHDAITFNDDAITETLESLQPVGEGTLKFVPLATQKLAAAAFARGLKLILKSQLVIHGKKTVWCQQHDELTLAPVGARNYEMPSLASGESATALEFLMTLKKPSPTVVEAINSGVAWFKQAAIYGYAWGGTRDEGRRLTKSEGAGPLWSRYYSLTTDTPIFGDRDKTIHDDVNEISLERRNGYSWFNTGGVEVASQYEAWQKTIGSVHK